MFEMDGMSEPVTTSVGGVGVNAAAEMSRQARLERRARREARREKQRALNHVRAQEMHAARMACEQSRLVKGAKARGVIPTYMVGCSGWYYWHWKDCFYPPTIPGSKWFDHYASHFRTVELNAPFYAWPTVNTVKTWVRQAGRRRFIYTVKVSELITHVKRFSGTKRLVQDFSYIADLLGPRMGCFLFQLPPSFHFTSSRLRSVLSQLDPRRRNVVEFRHRSWWNEEAYRACRDANAIFCSCSGPRLPDELVKTHDEVYLRFHGTTRWYRHDYTKEELAVWAKRVEESGVSRVWAYFNNDREGYAIRNAKEFLRQLKRGAPAESGVGIDSSGSEQGR